MNYKVVDIYSDEISNEQIDQLKQFCDEATSENKHAASENMQTQNWQENRASLLFLLLIEKRFSKDKGAFQLLYERNKIIAVSGYYQSDFDPSIYLMGVRTWVLKNHRLNLLIATHILPHQLRQIKKRGAHTAAISFNESTRAFAKLIERSNKNPEAPLKFFFGENYPDLYKDMFLWKNPVKIKGVKQWVLIKKIYENNFDWNQLNWAE